MICANSNGILSLSLSALSVLSLFSGAGAGSLAQDAFAAAFSAQQSPALATRIGAKDSAAHAHQV